MQQLLFSLATAALITGTLQANKQITIDNQTRNPLRISFTSKNEQGLMVDTSLELPNKGIIPVTVKDPFKVQYTYGPYSETVPAVRVANVHNGDTYVVSGNVRGNQGTLAVAKQ